MKQMTKVTLTLLAFTLALSTAAMAQHVGNGYSVTFDNGDHGWDFSRANCATIEEAGGNPGSYMNFSRDCDGRLFLTGWFEVDKQNPAQIFSSLPSVGVKIGIDIDVNRYDFFPFFGPPLEVEEFREVVVEIRDYDNPYTDPDTGFSWPYASVWAVLGTLPNRDAGWKHFEIDIPDIGAAELPAGWRGFGGPEDPQTFQPQLPPDRTFGDVIAGADEMLFTSLNLDFFYSLNFVHDLNADNITIEPIVPSCNSAVATVFVDRDGIVRGGALDGLTYTGTLEGTEGRDVIVGTAGADVVNGHGGSDILCGGDGDDQLIGGAGMDVIIGGDGANSCSDGEIAVGCQP